MLAGTPQRAPARAASSRPAARQRVPLPALSPQPPLLDIPPAALGTPPHTQQPAPPPQQRAPPQLHPAPRHPPPPLPPCCAAWCSPGSAHRWRNPASAPGATAARRCCPSRWRAGCSRRARSCRSRGTRGTSSPRGPSVLRRAAPPHPGFRPGAATGSHHRMRCPGCGTRCTPCACLACACGTGGTRARARPSPDGRPRHGCRCRMATVSCASPAAPDAHGRTARLGVCSAQPPPAAAGRSCPRVRLARHGSALCKQHGQHRSRPAQRPASGQGQGAKCESVTEHTQKRMTPCGRMQQQCGAARVGKQATENACTHIHGR
jgi:hypothetical protein